MMEITTLRVAYASSSLSMKTLMCRAVTAANGIQQFEPGNWCETYSTDDPRFTALGYLYKTAVHLYALLSLPLQLAIHFAESQVEGPITRALARDGHCLIQLGRLTLAWPTAVLGVAVAGNEEQRSQYAVWLEELKWSGQVDGAVIMAPMLEEFWKSGKTEWDECWYERVACVG
ncbi:hypothetical protein NLG97_g8328 [Lecanicillium saksenae]|uniref:Uncharacterized protein n=1 Tax=Lecanicillium saksenae TaxID=468837 RepID=A0ACC1QJB3_9HYPO|nr:hypothetical protein NLG97_g8328 [Lecanicillium saksenae]